MYIYVYVYIYIVISIILLYFPEGRKCRHGWGTRTNLTPEGFLGAPC